MNTKIKTTIGFILFAVFLSVAYLAYTNLADKYELNNTQINSNEEEQGENQAEQKIAAPDFTVYDAQGNEVKLSAFTGKPVVLNFWASWCPPCKAEMPEFNEVYGEVKDEVVFLMVDMVDGERETQEKGQKYIADQGFDFPVYFDTKQEAAYAYGISSIPTTVFIDAEGYFVEGYKGAINKKTLLAGIELINKE